MMKPRSAGCRRQDIFDYSRERYGTEPEALWATAPDYAVLRRADNRKWYALILRIPRKKSGAPWGGSHRCAGDQTGSCLCQ